MAARETGEKAGGGPIGSVPESILHRAWDCRQKTGDRVRRRDGDLYWTEEEGRYAANGCEGRVRDQGHKLSSAVAWTEFDIQPRERLPHTL